MRIPCSRPGTWHAANLSITETQYFGNKVAALSRTRSSGGASTVQHPCTSKGSLVQALGEVLQLHSTSIHLPKATFSPRKFQPRLYKAGHYSSPALPGSLLCSKARIPSLGLLLEQQLRLAALAAVQQSAPEPRRVPAQKCCNSGPHVLGTLRD